MPIIVYPDGAIAVDSIEQAIEISRRLIAGVAAREPAPGVDWSKLGEASGDIEDQPAVEDEPPPQRAAEAAREAREERRSSGGARRDAHRSRVRGVRRVARGQALAREILLDEVPPRGEQSRRAVGAGRADGPRRQRRRGACAGAARSCARHPRASQRAAVGAAPGA